MPVAPSAISWRRGSIGRARSSAPGCRQLLLITSANCTSGRAPPKVWCATTSHPVPLDTDALLTSLPAHSLVVNATGMGKDRPGSPISADAQFPRNGIVWEFNYRGPLDFLQQARQQQSERQLHVEDGWRYFIHGWTQVIAEVFDIDMPRRTVDELGHVAASLR